MDYVVDRLGWLHEHKKLVGGLRFIEEPPVLRFFMGRMEALENWGRKLADAYKADFGNDQ
jgi:tryptophanase